MFSSWKCLISLSSIKSSKLCSDFSMFMQLPKILNCQDAEHRTVADDQLEACIEYFESISWIQGVERTRIQNQMHEKDDENPLHWFFISNEDAQNDCSNRPRASDTFQVFKKTEIFLVHHSENRWLYWIDEWFCW